MVEKACMRWLFAAISGVLAGLGLLLSTATTPASLVCAKHVIVPGAARRYAPPRRWQFDSRRIYVRPRTDPQSAHGKAAGSQRVYRLGQLRA